MRMTIESFRRPFSSQIFSTLSMSRGRYLKTALVSRQGRVRLEFDQLFQILPSQDLDNEVSDITDMIEWIY
jgi:hypothetical protein